MTKDEFKEQNPIGSWLSTKGVRLHGTGNQPTTNRCPTIEHKPGHLCVTVNTDQNIWHCCDCGHGGDIIRWMALEQNKTDTQIIKENFSNGHAPSVQPTIEAMYDYYDETGKFVYQVCRMVPKSFRQRRQVDGKWVWNMEGVRRVLYNLPSVLNPKNKWVWVVEGEKDVLSLTSVGLCATTNVGGAGKWAASYAECLKGKEVVLCGDNDETGQKHVKAILESLEGKANSIRQITIPSPHKDVSDFISAQPTPEASGIALASMVENSPVLSGGLELPIRSMEEMEAEYIEHLRLAKTHVLHLSNWLPSLGRKCRGLVPGELVSILAATGVGKTALLQNLARSACPLPTLLFELELPDSLTFERFCALSEQIPCHQVEEIYSAGSKREWKQTGVLNHIWTCSRSTLTAQSIEMLINKAELKMGVRPVLVLLDYVQLLGGQGQSRYQVISDAAEDLKRIAKSTKTIIVIASQLKRKDDSSIEVCLNDAKESGSIENSSGLVLGVWRPEPERLHIRILKNTKGRADRKDEATICSFNGPTMTIKELKPDEPSRPYAD